MISRLPLCVLLLLASIIAAAPLRADTTPAANAVVLTFGRCDQKAKACPRPMDEPAAGDALFQSEMLHCFGAELGRPVTALGDAAIPARYWLDASFDNTKVDTEQGDRKVVTLILRHGPDQFVYGFQFMLPPDAASYREICRQFSERIRPEMQ